MGCGQKAYWEEVEEESYRKSLTLLESKGYPKILSVLEPVLDNLQRLKRQDLRLTIHEHRLLEDSISSLYGLLQVKDKI